VRSCFYSIYGTCQHVYLIILLIIVQNLRKTTVDGHLIHYYSPVDIWRILLSDSQYVHNWKLYFEYNNGTIEHPCNTDGWKEIEDSLSHLSKSHKLLLPSFFLDEYLQHNTSQKYVNSILMTLSNASKDVRHLNHVNKTFQQIIFRCNYKQIASI